MFNCDKNGTYRYLLEEGMRMHDKGAFEWVSWYENFEFEFNDRESYLVFRAWWKDEYLKLSAQIKEFKKDLKNEMRRQADHSKEVYYTTGRQQEALVILKEKARRMMAGIEAAKKEACKQMEEDRKAA